MVLPVFMLLQNRYTINVISSSPSIIEGVTMIVYRRMSPRNRHREDSKNDETNPFYLESRKFGSRCNRKSRNSLRHFYLRGKKDFGDPLKMSKRTHFFIIAWVPAQYAESAVSENDTGRNCVEKLPRTYLP